jgi:hypothetical protein
MADPSCIFDVERASLGKYRPGERASSPPASTDLTIGRAAWVEGDRPRGGAKDEFEAFLECGTLAHGFLRLRCGRVRRTSRHARGPLLAVQAPAPSQTWPAALRRAAARDRRKVAGSRQPGTDIRDHAAILSGDVPDTFMPMNVRLRP